MSQSEIQALFADRRRLIEALVPIENKDRQELCDVEQLAYMAGLFDGEGSVSISRTIKESGGTQTSLSISLSSTSKSIIDWIAEYFGGNYHILSRVAKGHKDLYCWKLFSVNAAELLQCLLPYLKIKKEQAIVGIQWQAMSKLGAPPANKDENEKVFKGFLYCQLRTLNHRGR